MLRKDKPKDRRGKIVLVNASREFRKGTPKNYLTDQGIKRIADGFAAMQLVDGFVRVITTEEAAKTDFSLSPSRYVAPASREEARDLASAIAAFQGIAAEEARITGELTTLLASLSQLAAPLEGADA